MKVVEKAPEGPQEWLDQLVKASYEGKFPAYDANRGQCCYRTPEGYACAVGLLIPDEKYTPDMDAYGGVDRDFCEKYGHALPGWATYRHLEEVQNVHDFAESDMRLRGKPWSHTKFVEELLRCSIFEGLTPAVSG